MHIINPMEECILDILDPKYVVEMTENELNVRSCYRTLGCCLMSHGAICLLTLFQHTDLVLNIQPNICTLRQQVCGCLG